METNYFTGTPLLADYHFSKFRFSEALDILEPYLKTIDDIRLYLLYAESCVFELKLEEIRALQNKLQKKGGSVQLALAENEEKSSGGLLFFLFCV